MAESTAAGGAIDVDVVGEWRLYRRLVVAQIRAGWQYRTSFGLFLVAQAAVTGLEFVAILFLVDVAGDLGGWSAPELGFLYGLATVPFAVADLIASPVERVSVHVRNGTFDRLLLRPVSALVQLSAMEFELRRFGKLVPAVAVLWWAASGLDVTWTAGRVGIVVVALAVGFVIYSALWILTSATSFWLVSAREATNSITYGGQFANQYPLHVYRNWIRLALGWVVPLAFVAYVPAVAVLDAPNPLGVPSWLVVASVPVAIATLAASLGWWAIGIRHYQGTGS